jgi:hypothetical protein
MAGRINAHPAKRFFVEMLTRDIELKDSILDLLDNCVDGAMREKKDELASDQPYVGFKAEITFDKDFFSIIDNCGGIPQSVALNRAFRLGRPDRDTDSDVPTVGVYGIGMKRAIFKLGRSSIIETHANDASYKVVISPEWLADDDDWDLPIEEVTDSSLESRGTSLRVEDLDEGVSRLFSDQTGFVDDLKKSIAAYYGNIISKGFNVFVNGEEIFPQTSSFIYNQNALTTGNGIAPYVYSGVYKGVEIALAVGFYRDLPTDEEEEESLAGRPSTEKAGWTLICNDRVVLYADKTRVTGWGEAGVPQYHTQFVSIAGVVTFKCNDASLLPVTTTKRGIDGNSDLYLAVKEFMREGTKIFTAFTNKWKRPSRERAELSQTAVSTSPAGIMNSIPADQWTADQRGVIKGKKFKPKLPMPVVNQEHRFLRFSRPIQDIKALGIHFFDDEDALPGDVGAKCFDEALKRI